MLSDRIKIPLLLYSRKQFMRRQFPYEKRKNSSRCCEGRNYWGEKDQELARLAGVWTERCRGRAPRGRFYG